MEPLSVADAKEGNIVLEKGIIFLYISKYRHRRIRTIT